MQSRYTRREVSDGGTVMATTTEIAPDVYRISGILAEYVPYTPLTSKNLQKLADLKPKTLAIMHGSSFRGDCVRALGVLDQAFREVFGRQE